jgi:hypothetical protein
LVVITLTERKIKIWERSKKKEKIEKLNKKQREGGK